MVISLQPIKGKCVRVAGIPVLPEYLMKAEILASKCQIIAVGHGRPLI